MPEPIAIAIDGPVASGKTVVGRLVARRLGYRFLDTGVMYRAVTWAALKEGTSLADEWALTQLAQRLTIRLVSADGGETLLVDGRDITDRVRDPEVERGVSPVAKVSGVREALVEQQRAISREGRTVMVGRDIGTVVLPDAPVKVFLTASVEVRARRRYLELKGRGETTGYDMVVRELIRRDKMDSERADSPLRSAKDAVVIDTGDRVVEELAEQITSLVEQG